LADTIHIVCLDAPAPPDYGGAIDMFYKVAALHALGKKIILHYFKYNNRNIDAIKPYCDAIYNYGRSNWLKSFLQQKPYIVESRNNQELIKRLNEDDYPVLLEGIHCTGIMPYLKKRKIVVRLHNDESVYYAKLAAHEKNLLKKIYFSIESRLLKKYQHQLSDNVIYAALSVDDTADFKENYGLTNVHFIPCFVPWKLNSIEGKGNYCLYHGNMNISENEEAALLLINKVFTQANVPFTIAGKNISAKISNACKNLAHIKIVNDPSDELLDQLIREAHINLCPSFNSTGVKLKLLHALLRGRFCLATSSAIAGSSIDRGFTLAETPSEFIAAINQLMSIPFTSAHAEERKSIEHIYNNEENARKLSAFL
jgi:hypothetical protein